MVEKDVQKRILKAILINGGIANSSEIKDLTGLNILSVNKGANHLVSRALIKKTKPEKAYPRRPNIWSLNNNLIPKIEKLISEIEE